MSERRRNSHHPGMPKNGLEAVKKRVGIYNQKRELESAEDPTNKTTRFGEPELDPEEEDIYRQALLALNESGITYGVGATFARYA